VLAARERDLTPSPTFTLTITTPATKVEWGNGRRAAQGRESNRPEERVIMARAKTAANLCRIYWASPLPPVDIF